MGQELAVIFKQLDPDADGPVVTSEARFHISDGSMALTCTVEHNGRNIVVTVRKWIPFRGPRFCQWLLTPLLAWKGMLFSARDVLWVDWETSHPTVRISPCVPPDFWFAVTFNSRTEAEVARHGIESLCGCVEVK